MIDRPTIERILASADIVDVVSEFVTLRKAGMNYKGLCPFHDDTTPSFSVSPSRNYCHCFSCGKGGTPVGFIMEHEQMTYVEALRWLAKKYHIEIKEREQTSEERQQESERESMFILNEWVAKYYHDILQNNADGTAIGMQYFRSRGFRDDIIERFQLGFALGDRHDMPRAAIKKGFNARFLLKTGLCYARNQQQTEAAEPGMEAQRGASAHAGRTSKNAEADSIIDRFAGRAIFPWISMSGKVVAFGGRKLDKETKGVQQKYVNSPDSDIYHKDHELYGIYQAKRAIAKEDCVYMVEGYTDVISMHQCGIENVVANSGTALSQHQIRMLHRLTKNIVLLYDGDAAGIKAAMRGTDMILEEGMNIKVLLLPDNEDPDSFARKHTVEEFRKYIDDNVTDFIQFKIDILLDGVNDPVKRSEAISSIVKSISRIPDPIIRASYLQDSAVRLRMSEATLLTRMNTFIHENIEERRRRKETAMRVDERRNARQASGPEPNLPPEAYDGPQQPLTDNMPDDAHGDAAGSASGQTVVSPPTDNTSAAARSNTSAATSGSTSSPARQNVTLRQAQQAVRANAQRKSISQLIMECVVKYGNVVVKTLDGEDDQGQIDLMLAEYVYYNLSADEIELDNPLYGQMLEDIVAHCHDEGFAPDTFFLTSPDINISRIAADMVQERYVLSRSFNREETPDTLRHHIERLLLELRRDILKSRLDSLQQQLLTCDPASEQATEIMTEYKEVKGMASDIARRLGNNILI